MQNICTSLVYKYIYLEVQMKKVGFFKVLAILACTLTFTVPSFADTTSGLQAPTTNRPSVAERVQRALEADVINEEELEQLTGLITSLTTTSEDGTQEIHIPMMPCILEQALCQQGCREQGGSAEFCIFACSGVCGSGGGKGPGKK